MRDAAREDALLQRNAALLEQDEASSYYPLFLRNVIALSCAYQQQLCGTQRVAYCGVPGAYAHIAAQKLFPGAETVAYDDFESAYLSTERGDTDCAVLPLENSYAGDVGTVMDLVFSGTLYVNAVLDLAVEHHLLGLPGSRIEDIRTAASHPHAIDQCAPYLREHGITPKAAANTAIAAGQVRDAGDKTTAAIASAETAALFGLTVLDSHINESRSNTTRFGAFSRAQNFPEASEKRTDEHFILVFTVQNEAGALAKTLNIIGAHGFNMRNLRSRPMKDLLWSYFFFVEADGNINTENGRDMLQELGAVCAKLRLCGTYRTAPLAKEDNA